MKTKCPSCSESIETVYTMIGASVLCSSCSQTVIPLIEAGTRYPNTGYEITFQDFLQLISSDGSSGKIIPLVKSWRPDLEPLISEKIIPGSVEEESALRVHLSIQGESAKQCELYQAAMAIWR